MFDIGFWEILLIVVLALIVIGPERLPGAARKAGYWVGRARRFVEGVRSEVEQEVDLNEFKRLLHNQEVQINELQRQLREGASQVVDAQMVEPGEIASPVAERLEAQARAMHAAHQQAEADMHDETLDASPDPAATRTDKPA